MYHAPRGGYDEAVDPSGVSRPAWSAVVEAVGSLWPGVLLERQRDADRMLDAEGAGHLVHDLGLDQPGATVAGPWRLDPVPYVLGADDFAVLSRSAVQRMRVLEALLTDLAGPQRLVREGVLPPALLFSLPAFRASTVGTAPAKWLVHYALDVVRDASGVWRVMHDATDAPSGLGYALMQRAVLARLLPDGMRHSGAAPISAQADRLRRALTALAPTDRPSPRVVVFTSGPSHPSYVEHSYMASRLGYHLVENADLVMREGHLWLRALDGLEPIDVVYRRAEDHLLDPLERDHTGVSGVPGLVWGARGGHVVLANAYGTGIAEAYELREYIPEAARLLIGEQLELDRLPPGAAMATAPVFRSTGDRPGLVPRPVVVRLHVVHDGDGYSVMPGGSGRVLATGGTLDHAQAHLAKDVWVLGVREARPVHVAAPPQVDFAASIPKRAADGLYWLGRAAERAEVALRTARVVGVQLDQDPLLSTLGEGGWALGAGALLAAAGNAPAMDDALAPLADRLQTALTTTVAAGAHQLVALVQEASAVREYLSATTGRVLGRLAAAHAHMVEEHTAADEIDLVLVDLAALAGLSMESIVRGPAWRFLDLGRRLERSFAVLGSVEAALGLATQPMALQPIAEAVLAANESLVAYRRRYRSDVDLGAVVDLLLRDDTNPRGLAFQLDRLREHVAALGWREGVQLVHAASAAALADADDAVVGGRRLNIDGFVLGVRGSLLQLTDAIVAHWFADPVKPTMMGGSR